MAGAPRPAGARQRMFTPPSDLDPVVRATTYPYLIPDRSYLFEDGAWQPAEIEDAHTRGRTPVIACGSNRSPEQLARKYQDFAQVTIPVQRAWLEDFDVVYAAHITGYGSIAANLQHVPGARVEVSITWLAEDQLPRMHATEGLGVDYRFARLERLAMVAEGPGGRPVTLREAFAYVYEHGSLNVAEDGDPGDHAGLAEIAAEGRPHRALRQPEAIGHVQSAVGHRGSLDDFIHETVADRALRRRREAELQARAIPFRWNDLTVIG